MRPKPLERLALMGALEGVRVRITRPYHGAKTNQAGSIRCYLKALNSVTVDIDEVHWIGTHLKTMSFTTSLQQAAQCLEILPWKHDPKNPAFKDRSKGSPKSEPS